MRNFWSAALVILAACSWSPIAPPSGPALFVGDSITANWATDKLVPRAVNAGVAGEGIHKMYDRTAAQMVATRPGMVHILAGTNDRLQSEKRRTVGKVLALAFAARRSGAEVIIGTIPPTDPQRFTLQPDDISSYNTILKVLATLSGFAVADYHAAMVQPDGELSMDLFTDGIHPNDNGYAAMRSVFENTYHP